MGRNDLCLCGSGRRFQKVLHVDRALRRLSAKSLQPIEDGHGAKSCLVPVCGRVTAYSEIIQNGIEEKTMVLKIVKVSDDLYTVSATPPDVVGEWTPSEPVRGRKLTRELIERGVHQTDVGDAMYQADPEWIRKLRDPYVPPSKR